MALGQFSLREVKARPIRVFFTFLSITIGVGAVVAVLLATSTNWITLMLQILHSSVYLKATCFTKKLLRFTTNLPSLSS